MLTKDSNKTARISYPGRVFNYLTADESQKYLLPFSCTLDVWESVKETLPWIIRSIKHGSGVKIHFSQKYTTPKSLQTDVIYVTPDNDLGSDVCIRNPDHRYILVQDSLETDPNQTGDMGILEALGCFTDVPTILDLTLLRAKGEPISGGLVSSGWQSFYAVFEAVDHYYTYPTLENLLYLLGTTNDTMIQGGSKRGIITTSFPYPHKNVREYLRIDLNKIPGSVKKGIRLYSFPDTKTKKGREDLQAILDSRNFESCFLEKARWDNQNREIFSNVCEGIFLRPRGTCLIVRLNLGQYAEDNLSSIWQDMEEATKQAIDLHIHWRNKTDYGSQYNSLEQDNQVAVDLMGLANLLNNLGISYTEFLESLKTYNRNPGELTLSLSDELVDILATAYSYSTVTADRYCDELGIPRMDRLHTIEPAQRHSFETADIQGYTTARGIWPIWANKIQRKSGYVDEKIYMYPDTETAGDLGADFHYELTSEFMKLMNDFGRPHAISFDTYHEMTESKLVEWFNSPLWTCYYQFHSQFSQQYLRKLVQEVDLGLDLDDDSQVCPVDPAERAGCSVCGS